MFLYSPFLKHWQGLGISPWLNDLDVHEIAWILHRYCIRRHTISEIHRLSSWDFKPIFPLNIRTKTNCKLSSLLYWSWLKIRWLTWLCSSSKCLEENDSFSILWKRQNEAHCVHGVCQHFLTLQCYLASKPARAATAGFSQYKEVFWTFWKLLGWTLEEANIQTEMDCS